MILQNLSGTHLLANSFGVPRVLFSDEKLLFKSCEGFHYIIQKKAIKKSRMKIQAALFFYIDLN
jgi:hypothetical protein